MSLRVVVAAPFRQRGRRRMDESEFVVALSLDRDWFSPDQASRVVDVAVGRGLLDKEDDELIPTFDPDAVEVPTGFSPGEGLLRQPSTFEKVLDTLVADGVEKQQAVAGINRLQSELDITVEAAAVVYARRHGVDVADVAAAARTELVESLPSD